MLDLYLKLSAIPIVLLLVGYPFYPRYLNWHQELSHVSLLTRQIFWVHNAFIVLLLILQATLLLCWTHSLTTPSDAGLAITIGLVSFWGLRLVLQACYYSRQHWWGKPFETAVHVGLLAAISGMVVVYVMALTHQVS